MHSARSTASPDFEGWIRGRFFLGKYTQFRSNLLSARGDVAESIQIVVQQAVNCHVNNLWTCW